MSGADVDEHWPRPAEDDGVGASRKVYDGMITSSPGPRSASSAAASRAAVQEDISRTWAEPDQLSSHSTQEAVKGPSAER